MIRFCNKMLEKITNCVKSARLLPIYLQLMPKFKFEMENLKQKVSNLSRALLTA